MEKHIEQIRLKEKFSDAELKHLASCRYCQNQLADYVEQFELIDAPKNLKASILERSKRPEIQFIAGTNHISKRLQFFYYTLKVSAAVLCVLTMLIVAPDVSKRLEIRALELSSEAVQDSNRQLEYYDKINDFTAQLNKLSNLKTEVNSYDKKER